MAEGYKEKLNQPLLTDAGRQIFLQVGNGDGKLVYTRATLSSQKPVDSTGKALDDEAIRQITSLPDDLKEGQLQLTPVQNDHFDVIADFNNRNQAADIVFSCVGWFARVDTDKAQGPETLIAIGFTKNDQETLAAGSPDGLSTEVISAELDVTISDAANIDMHVNEIGYVTRAELNTWQTKIQSDINTEFDTQSKVLTVTLNGKDPTKADDNHVINLPTYDKTTIDQMVAGAGKGAGINTVQGVAPNSTGNVDLTSVFYLKTDVDNLVKAQNEQIKTLQNASGTKDTEITGLNNQITGLNNQINDLVNRVKFLEQNAMLGKRFTKAQEADATAWENNNPNYIAIVTDN
ncbi:hypothetical protein AYP92_08085 [Lactobacillus crispatus]|uniref:hypothetical protein n=1 Tax=Lactobacillus TaxID=1578 RepID=UPI000B5D9DE9|nr:MULTISPECIES: hypothetical protein [Lactobacillus]OXC23208.1 hypothetical protein AYP83_01275 [Lactobacillus crispatus]OXC42710.1 hypothetical protein AYP92_08085 [Lactobacillus crispatus]PEH12455.1 hypothetical protein CP352_03175 [Lactobacillus sp. UMNPBX1]